MAALMNANQLLEQWVLAFNRGDVDGAQKLFAPNAVQEEIGTGRKLKRKKFRRCFRAGAMLFPMPPAKSPASSPAAMSLPAKSFGQARTKASSWASPRPIKK